MTREQIEKIIIRVDEGTMPVQQAVDELFLAANTNKESCQHDWTYVGTVNAEFCVKCHESRDCG